MSMMKEFRDFAVKGNVVDLAVGMIIGAAFGKIVDSIVKDVVMPAIMRFGGRSISPTTSSCCPQPRRDTPLAEARTSAVVLAWGNFLTFLINFVILAFIIFWMIKAINRVRTRLAAPAPAAPEDVVLLREIRDELKRR